MSSFFSRGNRMDMGKPHGRSSWIGIVVSVNIDLHPNKSSHISNGCRNDSHPAIHILDPSYRQVEYPVSQLLSQNHQLCVEKPSGVFDPWEESIGGAPGDGFETTLSIRESSSEKRANQYVVTAGNNLAL